MTLDALLAAVLFDEHGDVNRAHSEIPLAHTQGLWHGSAAIYEKTSSGRQAFVANLRASHDLDIDHVAKNKQGRPHAAIGFARRRVIIELTLFLRGWGGGSQIALADLCCCTVSVG